MLQPRYGVRSFSGRVAILSRSARALLAGLLVIPAVVACTGDASWQTTKVEAGFPELSFRLTGERGQTITEERVKGHVTLLFFGYTHCPDVCPATLSRLRSAITRLPESARERVRVLFVSVDPARDDPEQLAAYTGSFGPQFIGATGEKTRLEEVTSRYGSAFSARDSADNPDNYAVMHSSSVFVFDGRGRARLLIEPDHGIEAISRDLARLLS